MCKLCLAALSAILTRKGVFCAYVAALVSFFD